MNLAQVVCAVVLCGTRFITHAKTIHMTMYVDSHAHLTSSQFDQDRDEVIRRARDAGVRFIVNPGSDLADSRRAVELAERHEAVFACVGVHPHEASKVDERSLQEIEELSKHPKVVAIGEIGLDFHYDFSPPDVQERIFKAQIDIAQRCDLPLVIHTREALDETVAIVEQAVESFPGWRKHLVQPESRFPSPKGVVHCFPGDPQLAWKLIGHGFYISLPGLVTFKNAGLAADVAREVSAEHLLLETDSPYLTPVPYRGKRNEPAYLHLIAEKIGSLQGLSAEDIARSTAYSAYKLFGIGEKPQPRFTYKLRNSLYINLTIRCNADCVFCDRKGEAMVKGHNLQITREPTVEEVREEIRDPREFEEIVFCGFGEPTIRLDALKQIAGWVKAQGGKTRLNTDGHGNVINKRNIIPELVGLIDAVSISLNSPDPTRYGELMKIDGEKYFPAMIAFAQEAVKAFPKVVMTVVDLDSVNKENARRLVEEEIGAIFYNRPYF
jgi:TatD DNase family protein